MLEFASTALICIAARGTAQSPPASPIPAPCQTDSLRRAFDFWIGDWTVFGVNNQQAGTSHVEAISGGCALLENWRATGGGEGKSINTYDPATRRWRQFWAGQFRVVTDYTRSEWRDGVMTFYADVPASGAQSAMLIKLSFTRLSPDLVRQHGEQSTNGGRTWTTQYDLQYRRVK